MIWEYNKMEKTCEFCSSFRPVVYCKADAAYLCLSCDAKVHSSNALFNRHLRTLLCDACRQRPAYAQCLDHQMLMCRGCDRRLHSASAQHKTRVVSSYLGCPAAKDFAALWGFECGDLDQSAIHDHTFLISHASARPGMPECNIPGESGRQIDCSSITSNVSCSSFVSETEFEIGSSRKQSEESLGGKRQHDTCFIFDQIIDLKRLQLNDVKISSPIIRREEQSEVSYLTTSKKLENSFEQSQNLLADIQQNDSALQELKVDSLPLPFSQLEHSPFSSASTNVLLGESFWQCKSPVENNQLWSQNMQDLGVCEDILHRDYFSIPDVDLTFRNFEELFGGDLDGIGSLPNDSYGSSSSVEKDNPLEKSNNQNSKARKDANVGSSPCVTHARQRDASNSKGSLDSPRIVQPSYSNVSFSFSRLSSESSGSDYIDCGHSSNLTDEALHHSPDRDGAHSEIRENAMMRYKEKKKARMHEKQSRYANRKATRDVRTRGNR